MRQFVLTLKEARPPGPSDLAQIKASAIRIVDQVGRILKVEALDDDLAQLAQQMPSWHIQPEIEYKIPDTRRRIGPSGS